MRRLLLIAAVALAAAVPASLSAAAPGDAAIARATALQREWGRCPTAAPAAQVLAQARHTSKPVPRARRARAALRAWTAVAAECAAPVPMPVVAP